MPVFRENNSLITKIVRDLEWVVLSPLLLAEKPCPNLFETDETRYFLNETRKNPAPLIEILSNSTSSTLGPYFENLVLFWLSNLPSTTVLSSNIKLYREKQTLGELDVIFEHNKQAYHWELAVKFYLNIGSGENESDFIGPRLKDRLDIKLDRLLNYQLPRINTPEAKNKLHEFGVSSITSSAIVKGILFQPHFDHLANITHLPASISKECATATWIAVSDLKNAIVPPFDRFLLLKKSQWFTGYFYPQEMMIGDITSLQSFAIDQMKSQKAPVMACLFKEIETGHLLADRRIFIVPDDWPELARKTNHS
jgi:uncharacterized protein